MLYSMIVTTIKHEWGKKNEEKYQIKTVNQIQDIFFYHLHKIYIGMFGISSSLKVYDALT